MENFSLYIPELGEEITETFILHTLKTLKIGFIQGVKIQHATHTRKKYAIVQILNWFHNPRAKEIHTLIKDSGEFKIIYAFPHYWRCCKYVMTKDKKCTSTKSNNPSITIKPTTQFSSPTPTSFPSSSPTTPPFTKQTYMAHIKRHSSYENFHRNNNTQYDKENTKQLNILSNPSKGHYRVWRQ